MNTKGYSSFNEIDKDLKILRLEREIEVEHIKLGYTRARESLYPTQLLGGVPGILKKLFISIAAKKILNRLGR